MMERIVDHDIGDEDRRPVPAEDFLLGLWEVAFADGSATLFARVARECNTGYVRQRGVDYPCEECACWKGSTCDRRGFYRCHGCGYPGQ